MHKVAIQVTEDLVKNRVKLYISPLVLDEFIYAFKYILQLKKETKDVTYRLLKKFITEIFDLPGMSIVGIPSDKNAQLLVLDLMEKYSLGPRDAYHLLVIKTNRIDSFATYDTDFKKVFAAKMVEKV